MQVQFQLKDINTVAQQILDLCDAKGVVALHGEMGAGKTTLAVTLCKLLKVTEQPSSPTYTIANEYEGLWKNNPIVIYHMDWYRLKDEEAVITSGIHDLLSEANVFSIVEWSSVAPNLLPSNTLQFQLEVIDEETRLIKLI